MTSNRSKPSFNSENIPPVDPNIQADNCSASFSIPKQQLPLKVSNLQKKVAESERKQEVEAPPDPPVKVIVRIRPANFSESRDQTVKKVSDDSISVEDRKFEFDSVLDSNSKQEDVFELVGVPLVKSALAGYNTSILAYGQTGSGKTYTMWGLPSAMLERNLASSNQGVVPRIFQMLFSEIQREQENSESKQINYQCRCSFLEIYNEQIGDLLDPTQRNLKIKDDPKNGFYIENLTDEYVTSYEDVSQILMKGLSCRKVGATSINSKSSRSHIVFTCIIESWCKGTSSKCFSSSKTSRISLIDLAGLERNTLEDAGRQFVKEGKYIKKSISQLGYLVNILAERIQTGKTEAVHYESSCLTHLLREPLGGNAKLTVLCAISPDNMCNAETVSTLRFGQRAKFIKNEPVINEITEDDVNDLSDQIRQLKEELIREKSNVCNSVGSNYGNFGGQSVRESLNQLRVGLNRSLILPCIDNDFKEEVHVDEEDVKELRLQLDALHHSCEENSEDTCDVTGDIQFSSVEDFTSEHYISCPDESENEEINSEEFQPALSCQNSITSLLESTVSTASRNSISISACCQSQSAVLQDPAFSDSPKIGNTKRKSVIFSSSLLTSQENLLESSKFSSNVLRQSHKGSDHSQSSLRSSKILSGATESLAASLQRGLQIIDYHQRNSCSVKDSVAFSFEHFALKSCQTTDEINASVQTLAELRQSSDGSIAPFVCASCHQRGANVSNDVQDNLKTSLVEVDTTGRSNMTTGSELADAIRKAGELEMVCEQQKAKIEQLNFLVEQFKRETEQNSTSEQSNALQLELLKNAKPINELKTEETLKDEKKLLRQINIENHDLEIITDVRKELDHEFRAMSFDTNEKKELLKEIESLRSKLESNSDAALRRSSGRLRSSSLLLQSIQLRKSGVYSLGNSEEELEMERQRWMEMESDWISLTDNLRIDIESNRHRAEKAEMELRLEKKCTEELDDALKRSILGHARMIEHYAELQEKYMDLVGKHRSIMEGIAEVKKAATKAGSKGRSRFAKSLAAELSVLRVQRERERESLRKENRSLKIQLRDTAEAVHAAGELLVRLREAQEAASVAEDKFTMVDEENEKLKKQMEKLKRKHKMEMITMKQFLAESRLPEAALRPLFRQDSDVIAQNDTNFMQDDDQAWRAEFGAIYQEHY